MVLAAAMLLWAVAIAVGVPAEDCRVWGPLLVAAALVFDVREQIRGRR